MRNLLFSLSISPSLVLSHSPFHPLFPSYFQLSSFPLTHSHSPLNSIILSFIIFLPFILSHLQTLPFSPLHSITLPFIPSLLSTLSLSIILSHHPLSPSLPLIFILPLPTITLSPFPLNTLTHSPSTLSLFLPFIFSFFSLFLSASLSYSPIYSPSPLHSLLFTRYPYRLHSLPFLFTRSLLQSLTFPFTLSLSLSQFLLLKDTKLILVLWPMELWLGISG